MTVRKVLIGTLYSGEKELQDCVKSVKSQTYKNIDHKIIRFLSNKEAHDTLYSNFSLLTEKYDYFIKLDADMVFRETNTVYKIVRYFEEHPTLDHLVLSVHDFYTDSSIIGIHAFSNRCSWPNNHNSIFVDPDPLIIGKKEMYSCTDPSDNLVTHAFGQSNEDALSFGIHKASKIIQSNSQEYNYPQLLNHWSNITLLIRHWKKNKDPLCYIAINAIHEHLRRAIHGEVQFKQDNYKTLRLSNSLYQHKLELFTNSSAYRYIVLFRLIGTKKTLLMQVFNIVKFIKNCSNHGSIPPPPKQLTSVK